MNPVFRRLPLALAVQTLFLSQAYAASFTVGAGDTNTSGQTIASGDTGSVAATGVLTTSGGTVAVTVGAGTTSLTNSGTISQTGSGRTIDANTGTPVLSITNNQGGVITASGSVAIRFNRAAGSYLLDNQGTISQTGPAINGERAIKADANYSSTNNRIINGSVSNSAAVISSTGNDALRLGTNFTLTNYGSIFSTGLVNTSCPGYIGAGCVNDYSAADGVAVENGRSNVAILNYGRITGPRHGIDGGDPVAANADADLIGIDRLVVTATGPNGVTFDKVVGAVTTSGVKIDDTVVINYADGVITGNNGSGVGLDGHGVVINYGTITGNYAGAGNVYDHEGLGLTTSNGDGDGVDIDGVAYVENWGSIRGTGAGGLDSGGNPNGADGIAAGGGTIINHAGATIYGQSKGILIDDGANGTAVAAGRGTSSTNPASARIFNEGSIVGENRTAIGLVGNFDDVLINYASGSITGGAGSTLVDEAASTTAGAAVQMGGGADSLTNYGRIEGRNGMAIDMGDGDDVLKLFNGGGTGVVIGSIAGGAGIDTLETGGTQRFASGTLSGFERFVVRAGSTVFDYGLGAVTSLQVDAGASLQVNGQFSTSGNIGVDGTFLRPSGNALRNVSVAGDLAFGSTSLIEMGVGQGNASDRFTVTGTTTLAAGSTIKPIPLAYVANGAQYTLIQGGVSGVTTLAADADSATVSYALSNVGGNLILTASRSNSMATLAGAEVSGLAGVLEALGQGGSSSSDELLAALDNQPSQAAFRQALGQIAPVRSGAAFQSSQLSSGMLMSAFSNRGVTGSGRGIAGGDAASGRFWVEVLGAAGRQDSRADVGGYRTGAGGIAFGFESDRSGRDVIGLSGGYTQARVNGVDIANGDDLRVDGYHLGGYFSRAEDAMTLDASLLAAYNKYDSRRRVDIPGFSGQLFGDYHGLGVSARFEAGFPFAIAQGWSGRWLAGARAAFLSTSAYAETGNAAAALRIDDGSATSLQSVLGVELNRQLSSSSLLSLRTRYLHEFADAPEIRASLSSGGAAFTIDEQKPKRDALQLGLGYRQIVGDGMTISVNYDGEFKSESRLHQLTARVLWHF